MAEIESRNGWTASNTLHLSHNQPETQTHTTHLQFTLVRTSYTKQSLLILFFCFGSSSVTGFIFFFFFFYCLSSTPTQMGFTLMRFEHLFVQQGNCVTFVMMSAHSALHLYYLSSYRILFNSVSSVSFSTSFSTLRQLCVLL